MKKYFSLNKFMALLLAGVMIISVMPKVMGAFRLSSAAAKVGCMAGGCK